MFFSVIILFPSFTGSASTPLKLDAIPSHTGNAQHRDRAHGCGRGWSRGTLCSRSRGHSLGRGHGQGKVHGRVSASPSITVGAQPNLGGLDPLGDHGDKVEHVFKDKFTYILSPGHTYTDIFPVGILSAWTCSVIFLLMNCESYL